MLRLYVIRHGETEWSRSGQHTGITDLALTADGEVAARRLRPWLEGAGFTAVLVSPRQRARQTCDLAGLGTTARIEPDLAEWDYGDYEGRRSVDIRAERPGWNIFRDGCPAGEMTEIVSARADRLVGRLLAFDGNVALFGHGQFSCVLAARWIGLSVADAEHFVLAPASLSILGESERHAGVRVVTLWNAEPQVLARDDPWRAP